MAQNTQAIQRGNLRIKFSPKYPIGDEEADKLVRSLKLAERVVAKTFNLLQHIITPRGNQRARPRDFAGVHRPDFAREVQRLADDAYFSHFDAINMMSIAHHFSLPTQGNCVQEWPRNIRHVSAFYSEILTGLQHLPAIADAHSTIINKEFEKGMARWRRDGRPGDALDAMKKGFDRGFSESAKTRGVVNPKDRFLLGLTDEQVDSRDKMRRDSTGALVPFIAMSPEDYGSIHINFDTLLRRERGVSDLSVARTIIHEASHKFCNTQDYAYVDPVLDYNQVPTYQKIWNADSYAFCAVCLYTGEYIETDADMPVV